VQLWPAFGATENSTFASISLPPVQWKIGVSIPQKAISTAQTPPPSQM
jgi:hypothetical protein